MRYTRPEIERIAHVAFQAARKRSKRRDERRQGQRARDLPVLEGRRHARSTREYPDVAARPHVRRQRGDAARPRAEDVRRHRHRQHVRRHPVRRGRDADRVDRHAAVGVARRERQGPLRAEPRQRARHRRQGHRQSAGYNPVRRHDASLHPRPARSCRPHRVGGAAPCSRPACARPTSGPRACTKVGTRAMGDAVVAALHGKTIITKS